MKNDHETKERLLVCAREEFLEKGYQKASLRSICKDNMHDDHNATEQILHVLYKNYDICQMLLTNSQGSRYENCLDEIVDLFENGQRALAQEQAKQLGVQPPDDYILHWVIHIELDAYVHILLHERNEEKALKHMDQVLDYLLAGWEALFRRK